MAEYKIATLNNIAQVGLDALDDELKLVGDVDGADGVIVRSANMHEMDLPASVRAVARAGAGTNNIPLEEYADRGVVVFNTPGANANGVKELVLCGMLIASRDVIGGVSWTKSIAGEPTIAKDVEKGKKNFAGQEIRGRKLGVIGLGAVGGLVANAALDLGMKVYGYDPYLSVSVAWSISRKVIHVDSIDEIFEKCDYITVHVPLTDETRGMIGADEIAKMGDGVVVLNFARGGLIDDDAMAEALLDGKVARYVTDFPNEKTSKMTGCIAIPHLGASTEESEDNCAIMAAEELNDYLENGNIKNSVNFPACQMGECKSRARVCVLHKNQPGMIAQLTSIFGNHNINISDMTHKARNATAYALFDIEDECGEELVAELSAVEGVLRITVIEGAQS